jgi:hypothetical protein
MRIYARVFYWQTTSGVVTAVLSSTARALKKAAHQGAPHVVRTSRGYMVEQ